MPEIVDGKIQNVLSVDGVVGDLDAISSDGTVTIVGNIAAGTLDFKVAAGAGAVDASSTQKGVTKLSVNPVLATNPIAVGQNDGVYARDANFVPSVTNSWDLGVTGTRWQDLFLSGQIDLSSVTAPQILSSGDAPLTVRGSVVDGATAVGFIHETANVLATTGARHSKWINGTAGTTIMSLEPGSVLRDLTYLRGTIKIGDGITNTNYLSISTTGTLTLVGTARKIRATAAPEVGSMGLSGAAVLGTVGISRVVTMPVSLDSGVYVRFPKPEDFDTTVDPNIQCHFSASTSFAGNFAVRVTARIKANNGDITDATGDVVTDDIFTPSATLNQQKLGTLAMVGTGTLMIIRSVLFAHIQRLGFTNPGGADTHTGSMQLHSAYMTYTINGLGS